MRIQTKPSAQVLPRTEAHVPDPGVREPRPGPNKLLLLIPEGSLSFRLCSFPDIAAAQNYIQDAGALMQSGNWGAFWTHDSKPADSDGTATQAEAVVILRDADRSDVVQLYSFVDMQAALAYLGESASHGLDLRSAVLYWVTPASLNVSASTAPEMTVNSQGPSVDREGADRNRPADRRGSEDQPDQVVTQKKREPSLLSRISGQVRAWPGWDGLAPRIVGAALLKQETYEGISRDPQATGRAALIVGAGAVSAGIGAVGGGIGPGFGHVIAALAGWIVCAATVQIVGTRVFGGRIVSPGAAPQAIGLASAPALLLVLGAVPVFGPLFVLGIFVWLVVAMTLAVEPALELNRESATLTAAAACLLFFAIAQVAPAFLL